MSVVPARILIISNGPLCRNPRVLKEATALGAAGYTVTVLTVRNHAASESVDRELLTKAPFQRVTIDLLPGYETPRAVILWRRALTRAARKWCEWFGWQSIRSLGPAGALLRRARALPSDLVITHNEVPHWVGLQLQAEGRRVSADIEDWHSEDLLPDQRAGRPVALLQENEARLLAADTTTTSHALAGALHTRYGGRRPEVITNSFPLQPLEPPVADSAPSAFFWFSQTLGPGRGLEEFFAAWILTRHPSRVVLLGEPMPGYTEQLLSALPAARRSQVSFLNLVPPAELPAVIARHQLGLALEQRNIPSRDLTITNKILQYLNAGLAVVASDTTGQREVLAHDPSAGVIVDLADPAGFAQILDGLLSDPAALQVRRKAARALAATVYCWEREAPRRVDMVAKILAAASQPKVPRGHAS